ncbi:MAG: TIGR00366 family protein, partial [Myxococcota bacterium]|nr:TIGR00366 family protein [Myxococcota bacterium]
MIARLGHTLSIWAKRFVPDPLVLAILLTLTITLLALPKMGWSLSALSQIWLSGSGSKGFWGLLSFAMQMCLILITGHALAETPLLRRLIERLAQIPKNTATAAALVSLVAMLFAFLNWGLGLIIGA